MGLGQALGSAALGGVSGYLGAKSESDVARRLFKKQRRFINQARGEYGVAASLARDRIGQGIEAQREAYDKAASATSRQSRSARRSAKEAATKAQGQLLSRYGVGGKYGSTALDQARIGINSRLTRDLEGIDAAFAGLLSDLELSRGRAEASGQADLAQLALDEGRFGADINSTLAGLVPATTDPLYGALGGALGGFAGSGY